MSGDAKLPLHALVDVFGGVVKTFCEALGGNMLRIMLIEIAHHGSREGRIGIFMGIEQIQQPVKAALHLKRIAGRTGKGGMELPEQGKKQRRLKRSPDGEADTVRPVGGILRLKMDPVIFCVRAWERSALAEGFFLNIPFSGREGGQPCVLGKFQMMIQHENEDEIVAAAGAVVMGAQERDMISGCMDSPVCE